MERFCGPQGFAIVVTKGEEQDLGPCFENVVVLSAIPIICAVTALAYAVLPRGGKNEKGGLDETTPLLGKRDTAVRTSPEREQEPTAWHKVHGVCHVLSCMAACGVSVYQAYLAHENNDIISALVAPAVVASCWLAMCYLAVANAANKWSPPTITQALFYFAAAVGAIIRVRSLSQFESATDSDIWAATGYVGATIIATILGLAWPAKPYIMGPDGVTPYNPRDRVCPLSKMTFSYITPVLTEAFKKPITMDQIWYLPEDEMTPRISEIFFRHYVKSFENVTKNPALTRWLMMMEWRMVTANLVLAGFTSVMALSGPYIMKQLVGYFQNTNPLSPAMLGLYTSGLCLGPALRSLAAQANLYLGLQVGMHWRSALVSLVYQKAMRLSSAAKQQSTLGQMTNLVAVDAEKIRDFAYNINDALSQPLQLVLSLLLLFNIIGTAGFAGVVVMLLMFPLNGVMAVWFGKLQYKLMKQTDKRVSLMSEFLKGMRIIKFMAWEDSMKEKVTEVRDAELKQLISYTLANSFGSFVWTCTPLMVAVSTFWWYSQVQGHTLDAVTVFATMATFAVVSEAVGRMPFIVLQLVNVATSLRRLKDFLKLPEIDPENSVTRTTQPGQAVEICNASVSWEAGRDCVLSGLDFKVPVGQLLCVVGPTGGGKTALALAMLGEMQVARGSVGVAGRVAYVSQQAWIMAGTIRENILFGSPYDAEWYEAVVRACCLVRDLQQVEAGDATEIGEKGINMSGGQRQRINLARAVYSRPSVLIMDDPLSAVDAHVAKHIFSECCLRLLKGTTRVLVTHALGLALPQADNILLVQNKSIREQGKLSELMARKGEVYKMMEHLDMDQETAEGMKHGEDNVQFTDKDVADALSRSNRVATQLIKEESKSEGRVTLEVYKAYAVAAGGIGFFLFSLVLFSFSQSLQVLTDYWTAWWSSDKFHLESKQYLMWYAIIGLTNAFFILIRTFVVAWGGVRASRVLHNSMLARLLRAPMRFFDTTPVGRILNRFSKDTQAVDVTIMPYMGSMYSLVFMTISSVVVISMNTPWFMVLIGPVSYLYFYISVYYQNTARELKRYDSTTRSPIYSHFSESVDGTVTIRAYGQTDRFVGLMSDRVDANARAFMSFITANRWLAIRLETLSALSVFVVGCLVLWAKDTLSAGNAGMCLNYALEMTSYITALVRIQAEVEMAMNSVERMKEYSEIPEEPPAIIPDHRPPPGWPKSGEIEVRNLVFRYAPELPPVLKGVSLRIGAGEKVGIVGRTGAGKSSLMLGLFRIADIPRGSIVVDGVDITTIGVQDLRRGLGIIPQEPVLFTGTVRSNLDPFCGHSDRAMWEALHATNMGQVVGALPLKLDAPVTENGENFSVGQRQLLCLARAVLHRAKVLVLDEATASVDFATDACIQKTIRTVFRDATVLAVAHRLQTVIDYHRIAVLDSGLVREYGDPLTLISDPASTFHGMCRDSGEFDSLLRCAQSKNPDDVIKLLSLSADPNAPAAPGTTPNMVSSVIQSVNETLGGDEFEPDTDPSTVALASSYSRSPSGRTLVKRGSQGVAGI